MRRLVGFIVTNHQRQVFPVAVQLLYVSFYHERLENKMRILIIVKYDNRIAICAVSSKQLQCVYRHTKSYPAGERIFLQIQGSRVRSRPGPILSWRLIMKYFLRSFSSLPLNHSRSYVVSYKRKYVHEVLVNCLLKLAQKKVWLGELTVPP